MLKLLLVAAAGLVIAGPAVAKPPVWVVRDGDSEMTLFGSIHVLPAKTDWRPQALDAAVAAADDIWFELPVSGATEIETARLAGQKGVLAPDQSLFVLLGPEDSARLTRLAQTHKVSTALLDRLQPWMAEVALAAATFRTAGAEGAHGVERTLEAAARPRVQRRALETPDQQLDYFAQAPMAEQLASLRQTMAAMETKPDDFSVLLSAWMAADLGRLDREALAPLRANQPALFDRVVVQRNERWLTELRRRLDGSGRTVVVVGVGHLLGAEGLPARLRALGYSVSGP